MHVMLQESTVSVICWVSGCIEAKVPSQVKVPFRKREKKADVSLFNNIRLLFGWHGNFVSITSLHLHVAWPFAAAIEEGDCCM